MNQNLLVFRPDMTFRGWPGLKQQVSTYLVRCGADSSSTLYCLVLTDGCIICITVRYTGIACRDSVRHGSHPPALMASGAVSEVMGLARIQLLNMYRGIRFMKTTCLCDDCIDYAVTASRVRRIGVTSSLVPCLSKCLDAFRVQGNSLNPF